MNATDILNEATGNGEAVDYTGQSRPPCEYVPVAVEYIVARAFKGKNLSSDDMACLREIALHFVPEGSVHDFLKVHVNTTARLDHLLDEAMVYVRRREYAAANPILTQCVDLLTEWEFLRFEEPIHRLDDMLFHSAYDLMKVLKWRKAMTGFDFTEADTQRYLKQKTKKTK